MKTKEEKEAIERRICQALKAACIAAIEEMDSNGLWNSLQFMAKQRPTVAGKAKEETIGDVIHNPDALTESEIQHLRNGNPIDAIKEIRNRLPLDLRRAKDLADKFRDLNGILYGVSP